MLDRSPGGFVGAGERTWFLQQEAARHTLAGFDVLHLDKTVGAGGKPFHLPRSLSKQGYLIDEKSLT